MIGQGNKKYYKKSWFFNNRIFEMGGIK